MRHTAWWPDALALTGLAGLTLVFFYPLWLGHAWIPRGGGDLVSFLWPTYHYAARSLWAGRLPLWNPTLYSGAPFAADNQTGLFYPLNLLAFLLAPTLPYAALQGLVVGHVWLAGASLYALMRVTLRSSAPYIPALFSAIAYMFSDGFITHLGNLNIVAVAAWLPAALACAHLAFERRSTRWAMGAGMVLALVVLAGHAQMTLMVFGAVGLYALWQWALETRRDWRAGAWMLGLATLSFLIALGLSALALLPAVELTQYTGRARLDYAAAAEYSLPWVGLAGLFSPLVFGRGAANFWGPWPRVETGYLGVLPLLLAAFAPFKAQRKWVGFLALLGALGVLIALGANTPFHRLMYWAVPGFAQLRAPARFIVLADLALAALAGLGLAAFLAAPNKAHAWRWAGGVSVIALAVIGTAYASVATEAAHWQGAALGAVSVLGFITVGVALLTVSRWRALAPLGLLALLAVDLWAHGAWVEVEAHDPTMGFQHPAAVAYLQSQPGPTRIDNASGAWQPDAAAMFGLEDIGGISNPLGLAAYQTYLGAVGARGTSLYNFLNAQFVIADKSRPPGDPSFIPVFNEDPAVDIYLNTQAMARVSLVYATESVADGEAAFAAIHAAGFNPAKQVVIEDGPPLNQPAPGGESNLYYLSYQPESFSVAVLTPAPAYVVFSEVWYPGWRAQVDGVDAPVWRANFAFRAVRVEAGEHILSMQFAPRSWSLGLSVSGLTGAAVAVAWATGRRLKR